MKTPNTINGRTPEEIKKGLELCCVGKCSECPYREECDEHLACGGDMLPADVVLNDIAALIQQLERERDEARNDLDTISYANTELHSAYEAMKRERDAAVEDLETMGSDRPCCSTCLYENYGVKEEPCSSCWSGYLINNWKWRGVQEEDKT